jgi:hypothetical protein
MPMGTAIDGHSLMDTCRNPSNTLYSGTTLIKAPVLPTNGSERSPTLLSIVAYTKLQLGMAWSEHIQPTNRISSARKIGKRDLIVHHLLSMMVLSKMLIKKRE